MQDTRDPSSTAFPSSLLDSGPRADPVVDERRALSRSAMARWLGWRLRLLAAGALLGCLGIFALTSSLVNLPTLPATWRVDHGQVKLAAASSPAWQGLQGRTWTGLRAGSARPVVVDPLALQRSGRWLIDDAARARQVTVHGQMATALAEPQVRLAFADGSQVEVAPQRRGLGGLPALFWLLLVFGFGLYMVAVVVLLAEPSMRNLLYAVMACCQAGNLLFIAVEMTLDIGQPAAFARLDMPVRAAFDLITVAAMVNAACLHPRRLPGSGWIALAGWAFALAVIGAVAGGDIAGSWWWTQASVSGLGLAAIGLLSWSYHIERHPVAVLLRRFGVVTASSWILLTVALAVIWQMHDVPYGIPAIASMVWYVFLGSLMLLVPFLARSHLLMREFSLLAAISTIATSLDLLFVAVFSLGQFASLTLSLFLSLAVYSGIRQWVLSQLLGSGVLTTERMFEQLYRIAREVEAHPDRTPELLSELLRQLFDPMEARSVARTTARTRVAGDGSTLLVPVPELAGSGEPDGGNAILVRFAQRGRRLFTHEDARLTDRIVEQLRRAVAYDKAVEQGRKEERLRLAQDLHDDIGARLLTLMYQAKTPEMEDYLRHTLKDLKTLTRGLAASNHRLSDSAAEWKTDLAPRLEAAQIGLKWSLAFDDDILLTVVQWSALTRVLRELVSNAIAHAQAERLEIDMTLAKNRLELCVTDNGVGRDPAKWSHGLGLGGVRKRVKQLGGQVEWREVTPRGISCRVVIRGLAGTA